MNLPPTTSLRPTADPRLDEGDLHRLFAAAVDLGRVRTQAGLAATLTEAARALTGADGVTLVLREGDVVHYVDENADRPLWKGQRFPGSACISGWSMMQNAPVAIDDIYQDARIPHEAYRPTFVNSLVMVPVGATSPVGAIGAYWADRGGANERALRLLGLLAEPAAVAIARVADWEHALDERGQFQAVAAHELRSPLGTLSLNAQIVQLALRAGDGEKAARAADRLMGSVHGLERTLNAMLELVNVDRPPVLQPKPTDLGVLAERVVERARRQAEEAACPLTLEVEEPVHGRWDPDRLEQVLHNLLSNAFKYGPGQPVEVRVRRAGDRAEVSVRDHGVGIDSGEHAGIFERFRRGRRTGGAAGLGVGLWLVRRLVEAHGGDVEVDSRIGAGSHFRVRLPL